MIPAIIPLAQLGVAAGKKYCAFWGRRRAIWGDEALVGGFSSGFEFGEGVRNG